MARVPLPPPESMKLTVLAEIASGGMGSVEMARVESGRLVGQTLAIKRLHPSIANDQTFVDMFLDEAWLTAAMNSPHVMGVVAHGTDERGMFLAVELIEGVPLSRLLKEARVRKEQFSEQVVASLTMQICEGLIEAHGLKGTDGKPLGLVHRDLTPGNVLVGFDGNVKIVDFGIAKAEERITHTRTGTMKGKPAYMAPEQAKGSKNIDLRADLFSLGVMIFEFLASRRPWIDKSAFDVIMSAALKPHPQITETRPGVSPVWAEIIDRCLAKKASERWSSAAEIRDRLRAWRTTQTFAKPDIEVLREFVAKCSQAQIEWFRRARAGEFAKGNSQTFKELEEAIDEARKRSGEAPLSMVPPSAAATSSGRAAFDAISSSRARAITEVPASPRTPLPGAEPTPPAASPRITGAPGQATMPSLSEASRQAQRTGPTPRPVEVATPAPLPQGEMNATIALSDGDLELGDAPAPRGTLGPPASVQRARNSERPASTGSLGPPATVQKGLGGTEYMEISPLKGMKIPDPRIESDSSSDLQATIRLADLADRPITSAPALPPEPKSVIRPRGSHIAAGEDVGLGATLRSDDEAPDRSALSAPHAVPAHPMGATKASAGVRPEEQQRATDLHFRNPAQPGPAAAPPAVEARPGLSGATVVVLILVAFIAGGAIAAWVAKTYLVKNGALDVGDAPAAVARSDAAPDLPLPVDAHAHTHTPPNISNTFEYGPRAPS